jgi:ferrous iron transport protein A
MGRGVLNMPLTLAPLGVESEIVKINGKDKVRDFLGNLGFVVGEKVVIVSENGGNVIINVKGSRIALDRNMANRIIV